jgi:hypothetical protein
MSFFNRLGFDAPYYHTNTVDQTIPVAVSSAPVTVNTSMLVTLKIKVLRFRYMPPCENQRFFMECKCKSY